MLQTRATNDDRARVQTNVSRVGGREPGSLPRGCDQGQGVRLVRVRRRAPRRSGCYHGKEGFFFVGRSLGRKTKKKPKNVYHSHRPIASRDERLRPLLDFFYLFSWYLIFFLTLYFGTLHDEECGRRRDGGILRSPAPQPRARHGGRVPGGCPSGERQGQVERETDTTQTKTVTVFI